ncbi:MAG: phosphoribosylformylglycinamidine synthase subunit PurL [Hydrogenibacillus schlegelii]|uniref:Phosphoribosylformylglycinamidine synthase subunit PurL n=1 Tax=Hydrogenibacillus schlegelii TaxID=1484 RepID=A0A947D015_HYDSH|nr:phosphoribosylformylglycinamidine synthase subunit PurL [Hydrogenibacillus schlegelii]
MSASLPLWAVLGLRQEEYLKICEDLGNEPSETVLRMYAVMWSEHCAYKHSKPVLRRLPTKGPHVLQGPGENAGVVDLGDGLALVFKIESHNHPSAIEPFQGAATAVGGILRDVIAMGARPVALLDSLRFGWPDEARQWYLLSGVVAGIGHYGNSMGVPTVGGEVYFDPAYSGNCLVNSMGLGLARREEIQRAIAQGPGNPILVVGARTGRDGIGGAAFASQELSGASEADRPAVQVGDPFMGKLLMEALHELYKAGGVVGVQDCGAGGLTSACVEMANRGGVGMEIDVLQVPRREEGMLPWEVMLSESQERMVVCLERGREAEAVRIFRKWGLEAAVIGVVTDDGVFRVKEGARVVAEVPVRSLADGAPEYTPDAREPAYLRPLRAFDFARLPEPEDYGDVLRKLIASPNIASRQWVYSQYDHHVRLGTVVGPGGDAALLRLPGTKKGVAVKIDGNGRYCYLNPRRGAAIAVAEAARNVVCVGAKPQAITNNLNFGNPEKPEVYWQFVEAVEGMAEACRALGTPVTGGNVSFYNEFEGRPIYPTPTIGMVGVSPDVERHVQPGFKRPGDVIVLLGQPEGAHLGGSEYCWVIHGVVAGDAPELDLDLERRLQECVFAAIHQGIVTAAHDVAEGGLAVALAEMCIQALPEARGCRVTVPLGPGRADGQLFGETQSRVLVTVGREDVERLRNLALEHDVPIRLLGEVTADGRFRLAVLQPSPEEGAALGRSLIDLPVEALRREWQEGLERWPVPGGA